MAPPLIRPIKPQDDAAICQVITSVGREFGAIGDGFGPSDAEVAMMSAHYLREEGALYFVVELEGDIIGGGGIAPFNDQGICELRKLFLLPRARGLGVGYQLTSECLSFAKSVGYTACYLDTLASMKSAISLYEKLGFRHLSAPYPGTIHGGCDVWMLKEL